MKQKIARYFGLQNKPSSGATKVELLPSFIVFFFFSQIFVVFLYAGGGGAMKEFKSTLLALLIRVFMWTCLQAYGTNVVEKVF